MLFISNNKKIDAVVKELQPRLKLKINVERDFDCGLNDVFEKRPDVVFIQNQIAGVTGESVARHIQLLLGAAAPKFIFIHDGDSKAKPKKGLYEYLIDLSQHEEIVAADILEKLNLLLGPQWQNIFGASLLQGVDYEAFTPTPEPPREPVSSFFSDVVPGAETVVPFQAPFASSLELKSEITPGESFVVISEATGHRSDFVFDVSKGGGAQETSTVFDNNSIAEGLSTPADAATPSVKSGLSATLSELSSQEKKVTEYLTLAGSEKMSQSEKSEFAAGAKKTPRSDNKPPPTHTSVLADQNPLTTVKSSLSVEKLPVTPFAVPGGVMEEAPPAMAQNAPGWVFEGEPRVKKSTWKWYQVVELLLVVCLLLGGWYLIKKKAQPLVPAANEVNLLQSAVNPVNTQESNSGGQQSLPVALPSFIPIAGLDPAFAEKNPGWQRYLGDGVEYRLFRENDKLKAVQVKADKGRVISDALLKAMLVELTGAGEYRVYSRENKLGFLVLHATVTGKAELLIYTKNSVVHAVVVALD